MGAHDGLDGGGGLIGVIEGNGGDVVVQDVGFDDAVEEGAADEAEFAVDGGGGAAGEGPGLRAVVRERRVGVLEVCYRYWRVGLANVCLKGWWVWRGENIQGLRESLPSQWFTQR